MYEVIDNYDRYSEAGLDKVISLILFYGANINMKKHTLCDDNAIHHVFWKWRDSDFVKEAIRILLAHGIDVNGKNNNGNTALHVILMNYSYGLASRMMDIIKILLDHGADVNLQNCYGNTVLHEASSNPTFNVLNVIDVVKILLNYGSDRTIVNNPGDTAMAIAERDSSDELKKLLAE